MILLLLLACATNGQPSPSLTTSEIPDAADNAQVADCMKACLRNNMARAVAADVIKADCTKSCETNKPSMNQLEPSL
ncbi:MAG: hypothetical protein CL930_11055 [Deltaproteobacteria bacterium]|nr:hypothetical protein [Deltaproteobacteria bacterium]